MQIEAIKIDFFCIMPYNYQYIELLCLPVIKGDKMLKINDDLMEQCLEGFEIEYECPVFCTFSKIDSFLSTGRSYLPAFAAISKYRTLLIVPLDMSVYIDGSVDLIEYPLARFQYCNVTKTLFGNYSIRAKLCTDTSNELIKLNITKNVLGAELSMQGANIEKFAEMCKKWGNSGLFSKK